MSLFWKILLGFWLSLLLMALGAGAVVAVYNEAKQSNPDELAQDKRALFILDRIARELSLNGTQHLPPPSKPISPRDQGSSRLICLIRIGCHRMEIRLLPSHLARKKACGILI